MKKLLHFLWIRFLCNIARRFSHSPLDGQIARRNRDQVNGCDHHHFILIYLASILPLLSPFFFLSLLHVRLLLRTLFIQSLFIVVRTFSPYQCIYRNTIYSSKFPLSFNPIFTLHLAYLIDFSLSYCASLLFFPLFSHVVTNGSLLFNICSFLSQQTYYQRRIFKF